MNRNIDFDKDRWSRIKETSRLWWKGELKRPLVQLSVKGHNPGRPEPSLPYEPFTSFYDLSISAEKIVDRMDYDISCQKFLGDAFPYAWINFGPGVIAAFLGAKLENGINTTWFHPANNQEIKDIHFKYAPDNVWLNRIKDIYKTAMERWEGIVQPAMTDIGGNLDILSSFRPGEELPMDLYDHPDEVKRLTWDAHELWWRYFDEFNSILKPACPGYTAWTPLFSEEPYYILQCDFCYMIGPDKFDEFVKPELEATCKRLTNSVYHLDGIGQLPHLDSLLSIPELKGIQWVPGEGSPGVTHWPDVYRKIRDAGKLIQIFGNINTLDTIVKQLGSAEGIGFIGWLIDVDEDAAKDCLKRYKV